MLRVLGTPRRTCDGWTRREAIRAGSLSLLGTSLSDVLKSEDQNPSSLSRGKAKSVILVYLFGGPPLHDTFDPKPDSPQEVRGEFGAIDTDVSGVHFCEHLPRTARWMSRSTLIRSASHPHNDHSAGLLYTMTGKKASKLESAVPVLPSQAPSMNSVVQYLNRDEVSELPASVWMPCYTGWGQNSVRPGPYAGFLGRQFDPFFTKCHAYSDKKAKYAHPERVKGEVRLPGMALEKSLTLDRLDRRKTLLDQFDQQRRSLEENGFVERFGTYQRQAMDLLTSTSRPDSPWNAFDLSHESPGLKEKYGKNLYGNSMLVARRLVESGVRLVTVTWEVFETLNIDLDGWDTHQRNFDILRDHRLPVFDQAYSALCDDLQSRGLLDETLLVVMGEMGRTPRVNKKGGRDHWSYCHNVLLTGAGVQHGLVYGRSDKIGAYPAANPVGPESLIATIYEAMGIQTGQSILDTAGRPHPIAQGGQAIHEILS